MDAAPADLVSRRGGYAAAILALLLFLNILPNTFIWDDWQQIFENSLLRSSDGIGKIFATNVWGFEGRETNYYRPLMHLTFYGALRWFGFNPAGYHLISIFLHASVAAMVFVLLRKWTGESFVALAAALMFAAHPIHTENVCWISSYPDLEASFFVLLGLLVYCSTLLRPLRAGAMGICFLLALLSKETGIVLPLICIAWELFERRSLRDRWPEYSAMAAAFAVYITLRWRALGGLLIASKSPGLSPVSELYTRIALYYRYCEKVASPVVLTAFHKFPASVHFWEWRVLVGAALIALTGWGIVRLWQARRPEALALVIFVLALGPVFFLPFGDFNLLGERYLYLPSIGFCWLVAWRVAAFARGLGQGRVALLLVGILAAYSLRTEARNLEWRSEIPFYRKAIVTTPDLAELHLLLGEAYYRNNRLPEALDETETAASMKPNYPEAANNLGQIYSQLNQPERAAAEYRMTIQYAQKLGTRDGAARAYNNLAYELVRMGQAGDAILMYRKAIEMNPDFSGAYNNLGFLFYQQGQYAEAEKCLLRAIQLEPTLPNAPSNLGLIYLRTGKLDLATAYLNESLRLEPRSGESWARLGEVALAQGDPPRAQQLFRHALELQPENERATAALAKLAR